MNITGVNVTLVTVSKVFVTTGSSKDTAVLVISFFGGAAPGNIAAGLKFKDACSCERMIRDIGSQC